MELIGVFDISFLVRITMLRIFAIVPKKQIWNSRWLTDSICRLSKAFTFSHSRLSSHIHDNYLCSLPAVLSHCYRNTHHNRRLWIVLRCLGLMELRSSPSSSLLMTSTCFGPYHTVRFSCRNHVGLTGWYWDLRRTDTDLRANHSPCWMRRWRWREFIRKCVSLKSFSLFLLLNLKKLSSTNKIIFLNGVYLLGCEVE